MEIRQWMNDKKGTEKTIITDNVKNMNALFRQICKEDMELFHINVVKITDLAREIIIRDFASQGKIIRVEMESRDTCIFLVDELLRKKGQDFFIPQESMCEETAREVFDTMNQIRMGAVTDVYRSSTDKKILQIKELIQEYEALLQEREIYDFVRLIQDAICIMTKSDVYPKDSGIGCCFFQELTALEKKFLSAYAVRYERLSVLPEEKKKGNYHFFKTYGIVNEIQYVIQSIQKKKIPFGKVSLLYSSREYEPFIKGMLAVQQIPHCFVSGYSAESLPSIRLILDLLSWAEGGYVYEQLEPVVRNPVFQIKENFQIKEKVEEGEKEEKEEKNKGRNINVLAALQKGIDAGIGWGLSRYELDKAWEYAKERTGEEYSAEFIQCLKKLAGIFKDCQDQDKKVFVGELFAKILEFIRMYQRKHEEWKIEKGILEDAQRNFQCMQRTLPLEDAIVFIRKYLKQMVYQDEEKTDMVQVIYFQGMQVLERPYQYVIGLSDMHFGGNMAESPVLSDKELKLYLDTKEGAVQLAENRESNHKEQCQNSFATASDGTEFYLGYAFYDTLQLKDLSPSGFYLAMVDETNTDEKSIETVEKYSEILDVNTIVNEENVWEMQKEDTENNTEEIENIEETEQKKTETQGEYEENDAAFSFSPTAMETLLTCPLKYYYRYIRKIKSIEYPKCNTGRWLLSNEKGNLVHYILQEYVTKEFIEKDVVTAEINEELYDRIWKKNIEKMKCRCACDSKDIMDIECKETDAAIQAYLKNMHQEFSKTENSWQVLYCEKSIESGQVFVETKWGEENIKIDLYGNIDRIDGYQDETGMWHIRIIDYKTGKYDKMEEKIEDKKGNKKTIQHLMYAWIVNHGGSDIFDILNKEDSCEVEEFVYEFLLETEEEKKFIALAGDSLTKWDSEVDKKLENVLLKKEYEAGGECKYCSYQTICGKETAKA